MRKLSLEEAIEHLEYLKKLNTKSSEFFSLIKKYKEFYLEKKKFLYQQNYEDASNARDKEREIIHLLKDTTGKLSLIIEFFPNLIRNIILDEIINS